MPTIFPEEHYLSNVTVPPQLLGLEILLAPFCAHTSSQRLMMVSSHAPQALVVEGSEHPRIFSGYESIIGKYEFSTSARNQDIQIISVVPWFVPGVGARPINENPCHTVIFRGCEDNKVDYFHIWKFTKRASRYGYANKLMNMNYLTAGNYVPKEIQFTTSPSHDGSKYMMGTNANIAYMSIPGVADDAIVISESLAKKLSSAAYTTAHFKISPNQIPLNLYGVGEEYKFLPDIGEAVRDDGILCGFRTPNPNTIISDTSPNNLVTPQPLHDILHYTPPGAIIANIEVYINRKCRVKTQRYMFEQAYTYREAHDAYYMKIWDAYQQSKHDGLELSPAFNTLVYRALSNLRGDNIKVPGFSGKSDITFVKKKDDIDFIHIAVTYTYPNTTTLGYKLTGRNGDKGVICTIRPDEDMPVDDYGFRADIVQDPNGVFNRMNPGQLYSQYITRTAEFVRRRICEMPDYEGAFAYLIEFLRDINFKYAELVERTHNTVESRKALIDETRIDGIYIQISPFQKGIGPELIEHLRDKYQVKKSPVTYTVTQPDGTKKRVRTKVDVCIGSKYEFVLYKIPHLMSSGFGHVNEHFSPVKPSASYRNRAPLSLTPVRWGEDEGRNTTMVAGDAAARLFGLYANSREAVQLLSNHLLHDKHPSQLHQIEMTTEEIIATNRMVGAATHIFSCVGVNTTSHTGNMEENPYASLDLPTDE